ncbi:uncharacterized protein METZ01_LOCUS73794 [marine metagenome]|uniref:Uncharacterized protein n=1 Tax=marine metagenome TaxID=408172 RepID=A0A381TY65_9ZZZZ
MDFGFAENTCSLRLVCDIFEGMICAIQADFNMPR